MRNNLFRRYNRAHAALACYARTRGSARVIPSARHLHLAPHVRRVSWTQRAGYRAQRDRWVPISPIEPTV